MADTIDSKGRLEVDEDVELADELYDGDEEDGYDLDEVGLEQQVEQALPRDAGRARLVQELTAGAAQLEETDADAVLEGTAASKRAQVPSEREVEMGIAEYEFKPAVRPPEEPKKPAKERLIDLFRSMDPRLIEGNKLPVIVLGVTALTTGWDDSALTILFPDMFSDFKVNLTFMIVIVQVMKIVALMVAPFVGYLVDRVSRVWMVRVGELLMNASSILWGTANSVVTLATSQFGKGLGESIKNPPRFPLLADYYRSSARARVIAFIEMMRYLGVVVSGVIVGNLAEVAGWRVTVIVLGVFALLMSGLLFLLKEPARGYWDRIEFGASEETARAEQKPIGWGEAWRAAWSIITLRKICFAIPFLYMASELSVIYVQLYYAQEFGAGPRFRGTVVTITSIFLILGLAVSAPVADRLISFKPGRLMGLFGVVIALSGVSFALMAISPIVWLSILIQIPQAFLLGMLIPAGFVIISLVLPPRIRGLGIQIVAPFQLIAFVIMPVLFATLGSASIRYQLFALLPLQLLAAYIIGTGSSSVERDIRAAKANAMADEEAKQARASGRNKMIVARDVDVHYDQVQVLFNVDFDVEEGEIVALLGTNGAGKSTLLRAIAGINEASNGAIFLDGQDITHVPPHQNAGNGIVMVPGGHAVFPTLTVEENLKAAAWLYREEEDYVKARTQEVLDFFPILRERLKVRAGNMSGGEQQMLALAQAFLMRPRILMIDELSLGLAPAVVEMLLNILRAIHEQGTTILLVEQSVNIALTVAKRAVFMEKGEIRFDGPTEELLRRPDILRSVFIGGAAAGVSGASAGAGGARLRYGQERETMLDVRNITFSYGGVKALEDVSVDIKAGEIVGIIGPNGAGKTTLFDVISGFNTPDSGTITIANQDATLMSPDARARAGLGRSFQNAKLFPSMTVRETIAVAYERHVEMKNPLVNALWLPKVRKIERRTFRRADSLINQLRLGAFADKFISELSTGTRRVVDIACIMASDPQVLLLDEPSSGLAQAETEELGPTLTSLVRDTGVALLVIEHDWNLIVSMSDRLVAMDLGKVVMIGEPREVVNDPTVVQSYLGASEEAIARSGGSRRVEGGIMAMAEQAQEAVEAEREALARARVGVAGVEQAPRTIVESARTKAAAAREAQRRQEETRQKTPPRKSGDGSKTGTRRRGPNRSDSKKVR